MKTFEDFYTKGDFANALLTLEKNSHELSPGVWHFNAGLTKAKLQRLPEARLHFLKAKDHGVSSKDLEANLSLTETMLDIPRLEKPLGSSDYVVKGALFASEGPLTTVALLVLVIGLIQLKKTMKGSILGLTLAGVLVPLGLSFWIKSWDQEIVVKPQTVQEGPSVIFPSKGELPAGIKLITREKGDWLEIIYPSRFQGWIKKSGLISLESK